MRGKIICGFVGACLLLGSSCLATAHSCLPQSDEPRKTTAGESLPQQDRPLIDEGWWTRILREGFPEMKFFLDEIAIPDDQAGQLTELFDDYRNQIQRTIIEQYVILEDEAKGTASAAERQALQKKQHELEDRWGRQLPAEFIGKLEDILLPHQIERFNQALFQRFLMRQGLQSFELPVTAVRWLELSDDEVRLLRKTTTEQSKHFYVQRRQLRDEAWRKLNERLPPGLIEHMQKSIGDPAPDEATAYGRQLVVDSQQRQADQSDEDDE